MLNALSFSQNRFPSTTIGETPAKTQYSQNTPHALLEALQRDDWEKFEAVAFSDDPEVNIETVRFDNDKNCLHVAIQSGKLSIALNLVRLAYTIHLDLVNNKDQSGYSPLMYAAESSTDNVELVDALINASARTGLFDALKSAAKKGHVQIAARLIATEVDASKVLAEIAAGDECHGPQVSINAARLLISLGVSATDALGHAVQYLPDEAVSTLFLLGAAGFDAIALATSERDKPRLERLVAAGADVATALIRLAKHPDKRVHFWAVRDLIAVDDNKLWSDSYGDLRNDTAALLRLEKSGDTSVMLKLARVMTAENQGWDKLAKSGRIDAIKLLIPGSSTGYAEELLCGLVLLRDFSAVKTLLGAGVSASRALNELVDQSFSHVARRTSLDDIRSLIAVGADASLLPLELIDEVCERIIALSDMSPGERNKVFLSVLLEGAIDEVVMFVEGGIDVIAALQYLSQLEDDANIHTRNGMPWHSRQLALDRLIKAGAVTYQTLIDRVKAGDMRSARALAYREDLTSDALMDLIAKGDQETARAFVPALTDGQRALMQVIQSDDEDQAKNLIALGADRPGALLALLRVKSREAAGRLIALGVDIHTTLMRAVRDGHELLYTSTIQRESHESYKTAIQDLTRIGAEFSIALLRALELGDTDTAKKILSLNDPSTGLPIGKAVGRAALSTLIEDDALAGDIRAVRLKQMFEMRIDTDEVLLKLIDDKNTAQLKRFIALGAPTVGLLIALGKQRNRLDARTLIIAGADYATAIETLQNNRELAAVSVLGVALAGARDYMMKARRV